MVFGDQADPHGFARDTEWAASLYAEATALDSGNPNGRDSLGLLRCKTGDVDEGIALLENALELSAEGPLIFGDLGWCLVANGSTDEAQFDPRIGTILQPSRTI